MVTWQKMKALKTSESSDLQMYLSFETASQAKTDTDSRFANLDEMSLMVMIYDLKQANLPEDKAFLEAAQRELERQRANNPE